MALIDVLIDELRDLYSAENQLVKALPKLAKGANDPTLKDGFKTHLEETKGQVMRLRQVFEEIGKKPTGKHCEGMEGVIEEGSEALEEDAEGATFDSGLIGAALRTEHYEIAGYQAAIGMAKTLGLTTVVELLRENLAEEVNCAKELTTASKTIFKNAVNEEEEDKDATPISKKKASEKTSDKKSKEDEKKAAADVKRAKPVTKKAPPVDDEAVE